MDYPEASQFSNATALFHENARSLHFDENKIRFTSYRVAPFLFPLDARRVLLFFFFLLSSSLRDFLQRKTLEIRGCRDGDATAKGLKAAKSERGRERERDLRSGVLI